MRLPGPAPLGLDQRLTLDAALEEAFAPLRAQRATVGPSRVRAAVRWSSPEPRRLGGVALLARMSELTVAAAISAFLFAGAVASITAVPEAPDVSHDAVTADRWMLNGRNALQRPIDSRATDYRTLAGDFATNAAISRRPAAPTPTPAVHDSEPFAGRP